MIRPLAPLNIRQRGSAVADGHRGALQGYSDTIRCAPQEPLEPACVHVTLAAAQGKGRA